MSRHFILGCVLLATLPLFGQTPDSMLVGSVRLKLGMTRQEVLAALSPYEVHATNSEVLIGFLPGTPITPCEGENVACIATEIGQLWKGPVLAGLLFRANYLVYAIKPLFLGVPPKSEQADVGLARSLYTALATLVSEHNANCTLKATNLEQPNVDFKSALIVCGKRTISLDLTSMGSNGGPASLSASIAETLGEVPKR